ncbi:MoxR family ATPase [Casimicrobium huifangae]|uniref:AAA family ATPase n=1 Tax=Casimicrobium huifangae TaxID=2591109 RepID=UPI001EE350A7|nr:AAA family ATPase [Casimicrobium huifangae]
MSPSPHIVTASKLLGEIHQQLDSIVLGKSSVTRLAVTCLLAQGHLLIEDAPGLGKSTLALALAKTFGLQYTKVACTNDLLPSDLLGLSIWDSSAQQMRFTAGPIFAQLLLADELNRAPSKTQSALLEAMEERQVTVDGETRALPQPFFVIATQNPLDQVGVSPLPESQLDRFMMRLTLGFPDADAEIALLRGGDRRGDATRLGAVITADALLRLQALIEQVHVADPILRYIQQLLAASRTGATRPLSPRAGLALLRAARAEALQTGRDHVLPDDVQAVWAAVVGHRLGASHDSLGKGAQLASTVLAGVAAP